ncbi:MAG: TIGR02530 family flagellar biosynthesis protein [Oscillospiraceae bacterium]
MNDLMLKRISANIGTTSIGYNQNQQKAESSPKGSSFSDLLRDKINSQSNISFTKHAAERVAQRNIDVSTENLDRLNEGVKIAEEKGLNDPLILVGSTAFIVNIKNNKVVTTISSDELKGKVVTNIDGTVII